MRPTLRTIGQFDSGLYESPGRSSDHPMWVDDDENESADGTPPETPQKKRKLGGTPAPTPMRTPRSTRAAASTPSKRNINGIDYTDKGTVYDLDKIRAHFKEHSKSKVPDYLQPMVVNDEIKGTLRNWQIPLEQHFVELDRELKDFFRQVFDRHFQSRAETPLYTAAWRIVEDMFDTSMAEQRFTMAENALNNELEGPYMFNEKKFDHAKEITRQTYNNARFNARMKVYIKEMTDRVGERATNEDRLRKDPGVCALIGKDPYDKEVDVIARITSYYELAVDRFHDIICMSIEGQFFKRLRTKLHDEMLDTLGIHDIMGGAQTAIDLLAEPSQNADRRRQLIAMKNALLEGQRHLDELQAKHGNKINATQLPNGYSTPAGLASAPFTDEMEGVIHGYA